MVLETVRAFTGLVERGRRWRWAALVVMALAATGVEMGGAVLIFVVLGLVAGSELPTQIPLVGELGQVLPFLTSDRALPYLLVGIAVFFVVRAGVMLAQVYLQNRVAHNTGVNLSTRLLHGYLTMPYAFHLQRNSAELIRNAYWSVDSVINFALIPMVRVMSESLLIAGIAAVLFITAPTATVAAVGILGPIVFVFLRLVQPRMRRLGWTSEETSSASLMSMQQSLEGLRDIRVLGREHHFERQFNRSRAALARSQYLRAVLDDTPRITLETILVLFILGFLGVNLALAGQALGSLPILGVFAYSAMRLMPALNRALASVNKLKYAQAAVGHVLGDLTSIPTTSGRSDGSQVEPVAFSTSIALRDVSFRYDGADTQALKGITVHISKGESLGVVGTTGAGKSTLIDLLLGLLAPTSGTVLVDDRDIAGNLRGWQQNLGMVPQVLFMTDDTLRRNIALGYPDDEIDDERVRYAVEAAQLSDLVEALPDGLDTVLGERGVRLSGGQRQRIAIARALYREPQVLIMDEGTASLDNLTEAEVVKALEGLRGRCTMITVAHRLTTVRGCDRILVLEQGRIADSGTFDELLSRNAAFQAMAR